MMNARSKERATLCRDASCRWGDTLTYSMSCQCRGRLTTCRGVTYSLSSRDGGTPLGGGRPVRIVLPHIRAPICSDKLAHAANQSLCGMLRAWPDHSLFNFHLDRFLFNFRVMLLMNCGITLAF